MLYVVRTIINKVVIACLYSAFVLNVFDCCQRLQHLTLKQHQYPETLNFTIQFSNSYLNKLTSSDLSAMPIAKIAWYCLVKSGTKIIHFQCSFSKLYWHWPEFHRLWFFRYHIKSSLRGTIQALPFHRKRSQIKRSTERG